MTEAQLGHRPAAEEAIKERRRINQLTTAQKGGETLAKLLPEWQVITESAVSIILGDYDTAYADSAASAARIKKIPAADEASIFNRSTAYRYVLTNAAQAALRLEHGTDAESAARAMLDEPTKGAAPDRITYWTEWEKVLLAHALGLQGRRVEAQPTLDSALVYYREQQSKLITGVGFLQRVARVISGSGAQVNKATASVEFSYRAAYAAYVNGLFQPDDSAGRAARRDALEEAAKALQGIPEESKQLHEWKELNDLIFKARLRPGK